ncbi:MAG: hypothetical protein M3Q83_02485 [Pseudomonadota bacterium]|nr:hypothetical protein [Pseudomonadota bacterium]
MNMTLSLSLVLAGTALVAASAGAAVLVVRSSGPSAVAYPPGKALGDTQTVRLKANDMIVLLDSRGTRTLRGPGNFSTSAASSSASGSSLAAVTGQVGSRRARVQAVRGGPTGATGGRNVWQADVSRSGSVCVANPSDLGLYRGGASGEAHVTLTDAASGKSSTVHFEPGQTIARWPAELAVATGTSFNVKGAGAPATLQMKMVAPVPSGLEGMAQSFIRNDCNAQLDVLIDTFSAPAGS